MNARLVSSLTRINELLEHGLNSKIKAVLLQSWAFSVALMAGPTSSASHYPNVPPRAEQEKRAHFGLPVAAEGIRGGSFLTVR